MREVPACKYEGFFPSAYVLKSYFKSSLKQMMMQARMQKASCIMAGLSRWPPAS